MGASSPLILSLSTVFALIGIVLVAIAFGTNNWLDYEVDRVEVERFVEAEGNRTLLTDIRRQDIYYSRTYGLFRECFPKGVPNGQCHYIVLL